MAECSRPIMRRKSASRCAGGFASSPANVRKSPPAMKCLPAPRNTTTRSASSAATSAAAVDQRIHQREVERVERVGAIERQRRDGAVAFDEKRGTHGDRRRWDRAEGAASVDRSAVGRLPERRRRLQFVGGVRDVDAFARAEVGDGRREVRGRRSRAANAWRPAAGRARACARPARRLRSARGAARCRIRSTGNSRLRSAGPDTNSRRSPVAAPQRLAVVQAERGADPSSIARADDEQHVARAARAPMRSKKSRLRYGVE